MRYVVLLVLVLAVGCEKPATTSDLRTVDGKEQARKTYTRDQFRDLLVGKTPDEVVKAVGKPDRTHDIAGRIVWHYDGMTTDPATGKPDRTAQVIFEQGVVNRVNY